MIRAVASQIRVVRWAGFMGWARVRAKVWEKFRAEFGPKIGAYN